MYVIGLFIGARLASYRAKTIARGWTADNIDDLVLVILLAIMAGGRLGEMLFYQFSNFKADPLSVFYTLEGGMSFHGGLLGILIAIYFYAKRSKKRFLEVTDFIAPLTPPGLAAGRLGNFINGELWGRPTHVPWAVIFPQMDFQPRHPSQLYEMLLEGVLLFIILWPFSKKPKAEGAVSGLFAVLYASARFLVEFFREPSSSIGFIWGNWLTMGQLLSIPLFIGGVILLLRAYKFSLKTYV
jgi:phosphatidylglycerol:prolipoprotein diacylglycerol transferase